MKKLTLSDIDFETYSPSLHRDWILRLESINMVEPWDALDVSAPRIDVTVATKNGKPIGFIAYMDNPRGIDRCGDIMRIIVERKERRQGVATLLVEKIRSTLTHWGTRSLRVIMDDEVHRGPARHTAARFFASLGMDCNMPTNRNYEEYANSDVILLFRYNLPDQAVWENRIKKYL